MNNAMASLFLKFNKLFPESLLSKLDPFKSNLAKASLKISFKVYIGLIVFSATVTSITAFTASFLIFSFLNFQIFETFAFSLAAALIGAFSAVGICLFYPLHTAQARAVSIDANLPTIANFMSVLASSGMPPEAIIRSLARVSSEFDIQPEASTLVAEMELAGIDLQTALRRASEVSPSKQFARLLDGIVTTSYMGGDLAGFLRGEADKFKRNNVTKMKRFLDNLSVISEAYVTFMVAAPLTLIIMLSVMAFIGGGVMLGGLDAGTLLNIMTFVFLPAGVAVMILAVDNMNPQK